MYARLKAMLGGHAPDGELRYKAELAARIVELKRDKNAVILGHNYMEPALYHTIPDFVGDSLELSRKAATTDKEVIVFCGVRFMAETAKILSPDKTVLLPSEKAGCSLAASITAEDVRALKARFPGVPVVTYVNTYAEVKAESDICCTSSNAAAVVESLQSPMVIFLPDEYLARNIAQETGKHILFPSLLAGGGNTGPGRRAASRMAQPMRRSEVRRRGRPGRSPGTPMWSCWPIRSARRKSLPGRLLRQRFSDDRLRSAYLGARYLLLTNAPWETTSRRTPTRRC
jgi:hypothetical protein